MKGENRFTNILLRLLPLRSEQKICEPVFSFFGAVCFQFKDDFVTDLDHLSWASDSHLVWKEKKGL